MNPDPYEPRILHQGIRAYLDLGDRVAGQVLDEDAWVREDRIRPARPAEHAAGEVRVVYPYAPTVVGIVTDTGDALTVRVQR